MEFSELKNKSEKELKELLAEKNTELQEMRFKISERQLKNVRLVREIRKTVARIMTALSFLKKAQVK